MDELLARALSTERAINAALADASVGIADVLWSLELLSSRMAWHANDNGVTLLLPHDGGDLYDDGTDWRAKIHGIIRMVRVAPERGRRAVRRALLTARRELAPLTGAAKLQEVFA